MKSLQLELAGSKDEERRLQIALPALQHEHATLTAELNVLRVTHEQLSHSMTHVAISGPFRDGDAATADVASYHLSGKGVHNADIASDGTGGSVVTVQGLSGHPREMLELSQSLVTAKAALRARSTQVGDRSKGSTELEHASVFRPVLHFSCFHLFRDSLIQKIFCKIV